MQSMSARDAKNSFGKLIDMARAEPVAIEKHGRPVVVVLSIESYEMLRACGDGASPVHDTQAHMPSLGIGSKDKNGKAQ
ncbi:MULTISPECIES: type II toxin-antitoxin system Phd/YefM family antitoxin [unclassified Pseudomonas]|uniref:type II toxin-antitoxin system Phd/YefM family antitoxin n=1 Tax=unclassified Pseudomonas TaxID=196821 RepID=UPI00244C2A0A|nr:MULTISPECIES: type II toxin-antitoxin system Phd/YefM family antitoxin [unclassified Pseudomonas]MDG9924462.1 type II toxin-antitoxin system Phd/YefM family antitoxin [Pseudomonas sp. GD04045]MDH0035198.1 type II toxin-antitoxin system Phd/YefM family antitoxin [Pseudomonas sp. GD04019]